MWRFLAICLLAAFFSSATSAAAAEWGDLTGKVVIRFQQAPAVATLQIGVNQTIPDESLLVAAGGGLANVVIYVRTSPVPIHPVLAGSVPPHATLAIKDSIVRPRVLPVWIGQQTVLLGNLDKTSYNPNVRPRGDQAFNCLLPPGQSETWQPARQQNIPVPVDCNIKPWIRAYLLPRSNPYAAVTDKQGEFQLSLLPAGSWEFQLWHEKYGYLDTSQQPKGRFTHEIKPGENKLQPILVER